MPSSHRCIFTISSIAPVRVDSLDPTTALVPQDHSKTTTTTNTEIQHRRETSNVTGSRTSFPIPDLAFIATMDGRTRIRSAASAAVPTASGDGYTSETHDKKTLGSLSSTDTYYQSLRQDILNDVTWKTRKPHTQSAFNNASIAKETKEWYVLGTTVMSIRRHCDRRGLYDLIPEYSRNPAQRRARGGEQEELEPHPTQSEYPYGDMTSHFPSTTFHMNHGQPHDHCSGVALPAAGDIDQLELFEQEPPRSSISTCTTDSRSRSSSSLTALFRRENSYCSTLSMATMSTNTSQPSQPSPRSSMARSRSRSRSSSLVDSLSSRSLSPPSVNLSFSQFRSSSRHRSQSKSSSSSKRKSKTDLQSTRDVNATSASTSTRSDKSRSRSTSTSQSYSRAKSEKEKRRSFWRSNRNSDKTDDQAWLAASLEYDPAKNQIFPTLESLIHLNASDPRLALMSEIYTEIASLSEERILAACANLGGGDGDGDGLGSGSGVDVDVDVDVEVKSKPSSESREDPYELELERRRQKIRHAIAIGAGLSTISDVLHSHNLGDVMPAVAVRPYDFSGSEISRKSGRARSRGASLSDVFKGLRMSLKI